MLSLDNIKKSKGAKKNRKRIGRGNASGTGTYSGKGQKGQASRSGVSNLKRMGMKKQLLQIPKVRGFKSHRPKNQVVSVKAINNNFKDGEVVNVQTLFDKNLVSKTTLPVKILGKEKLTVKVEFERVSLNATIREQVKDQIK